MSFKQILEGWRNHIIPPHEMKEVINITSTERMNICKQCEWFSENKKKTGEYNTLRPDEHCTNCGCTLSAKTKCLSCSCPLSLWDAVTTDESIDDELNDLK
jgi:hypothetical protein